MSRYLDKKYASLEAYTPGEQPRDMRYIKLNTNESPFPPAPPVYACLTPEAASAQRLYPDPQGKALRARLAKTYGVESENVMLANGSDDILNFAFMAYGAAGFAFADISYGFNRVFAKLHGTNVLLLPLREDLTIDPKPYMGVGRSVLLDNPNAPTGEILSLSQIEEIVQSNPDNMVVIDEAYVDFGAQSALPLIKKYENVLIVRTYSKSRSMAGSRLGFALAPKAVIDDLELLRNSTNPYNINRLTLAMGEAALEDADYFNECCTKIMENRAYAQRKLQALSFLMTNSYANFLFARHESISGMEIYTKLKERGVLVRHFETPRLKNYNRITIGTKEQMDALCEKLKEIIGEEH